MKTDYSVVRYHYYEDDGSGYKMDVHSSKRVVKKCTSRYHNCQHKLAPLSKCAEMFLRFLTEKMDKTNTIVNSGHLRNEFIEHMSKDCGLKYANDTIKHAFSELTNQDLLIKYRSRGLYNVNPIYYFNGSERERIDLIQKLIHHAKSNTNINSNIISALGL